MKREMIFLGPPACGKGTQTNRLAEYFNLPHVDTGSLLRAEIKSESENGKIAKQYIDKGQLVPVELVAKIIKDRLAQKDCEEGYILDGFPRSAEQADMLPKCGEIYNIKFHPPKTEGVCDKCGTELTQRKDDNEETAKARFETYFRETAPLVDYYKNKEVLRTIDANGTIDEVWERLLKVVND